MSGKLKLATLSLTTVAALLPGLFAATLTVSQGGGAAYSSIQAAVNAASPGDVIEILDFSIYNEQVTIDSSKSGLTIRSSNPLSPQKPVIHFKDTLDVHPKTAAEAAVPPSPSVFDYYYNGALRLIQAYRVTIDGLSIDGGEPYAFGSAGVWVNPSGGIASPLFHGNVALDVFKSGDLEIRNCEFKNAFFGIYVGDPNEGGIYANGVNPSDADSLRLIQFIGFSKTGNNLYERNRIHDNSFGMFFESSWNLGSTIRYNLFYENHYATDAFGKAAMSMPGGADYPGGCFLFKDEMLSPLAIYNNTFWHNSMIYVGHWRAGPQHLVFNNIYAAPYKYWGNITGYNFADYMSMDGCYAFRTHSCVYAVQQQQLDKGTPNYAVAFDSTLGDWVHSDTVFTYQARIMNNLGDVQSTSFTLTATPTTGTPISQTFTGRLPGNLIVGLSTKPAFPADANVRWLETKFKSTDPLNADFLAPDWSDSLVKKYIVNKGWNDIGIRDTNETAVDIGAIPLNGIPSELIRIKPTNPCKIVGTTATVWFTVTSSTADLKNIKIKYMTWVNNIMQPKDSAAWSSQVTVIPAADLISLPVTSTTISLGNNTISFTVPQRTAAQKYAFLEMTVEGQNSNGKLVTSDVGFMPYNQACSLYTVSNRIRPAKLDFKVSSADLLDLKGRVIRKASKINGCNIKVLESALQFRTLPQGIYLLRMKDVKTGAVVYKQILK